MDCPKLICPVCGDLMLHSMNRGANESSSAYGQYIHDNYPNTFYWCDIDGIIYKKKTKILRIIEHKKNNGRLSRGQSEILPMLSEAIKFLIAAGLIHQKSGVFVVRSEPPFDLANIHMVGARGSCAVSGVQLEQFETGLEINWSASRPNKSQLA